MQQSFILSVCSLLLIACVNAFPDEAARAEVTPTPQPPSTKPPRKSQGTVEDRTRLAAHLFNNGYNKHINPDGVVVKFGVVLMDFSVSAKKSSLTANVWISEQWNDSRLAWNPEEFGGARKLRYAASEVWKPDVTLYSSKNTENLLNCWESPVVISSSGEVSWIPTCEGTTSCPQMDLIREPYGNHTCSFKIGSWTYDSDDLDIELLEDKIDLTSMQNTSGFKVMSTTAEKVVKHYSCCTEPYVHLLYNMTVQRKAGEELFH